MSTGFDLSGQNLRLSGYKFLINSPKNKKAAHSIKAMGGFS